MKDFDSIYAEYYSAVYKYILTLCHDKNVAEEITQEAFFKALKSIDKFRGKCKLSVWLCQIAKNTFLTWKSQNKRCHEQPIDTLEARAEKIDNIYYFTGEYNGLENLSAEELTKKTQDSVLLWSK